MVEDTEKRSPFWLVPMKPEASVLLEMLLDHRLDSLWCPLTDKKGGKMAETKVELARCVNWMLFDAIQETVKDYNSKWAAPDEQEFVLTEFNMAKNCSECNMRPRFTGATEELMQIAEIFKDPILAKLESAGMKRKCYKGKG